MMKIVLAVVQVLQLVALACAGCKNENWWKCFDQKGFCTCSYSSYYMNGLWRYDNDWTNDYIYKIESAKCCSRTRPFYNQPSVCMMGDWWHSFDRRGWSTCPSGFFLRGLYRTSGHHLHNIEWGKCCKPAYHPYWHGSCYNKDVGLSFDKKGWNLCAANYFMAGFYRSDGNKLFNIEQFKCCKMVSAVPSLKSLSDVKTRVMDVTLYNLALLAHYLGYGWCAGCRAQYAGEDFRRRADSWEADKKGPCNGYKSDHRLKLHYKHFSFGIKNIKYGKAVIQSLVPQTYDSGPVRNTDSHPLTTTITREVSSTRSVTHTTTSSWSNSHELGVTIGYQPPDLTGGVTASASYKFSYTKSSSTTDSTGKQQTTKFTISSKKTLGAHKSAEWRIMLSKQRVTVPYTATIIAKFSAELDGFLRWGGGYNGGSTNFHVNHRGSGSRPTFKYTFGNDGTPFYTALKEQSDRNMYPWQWHNMKQKYSYARSVINQLTNEKYYEFTLTGQFEDVHGVRADLQWKNLNRKRGLPKREPALEHDFPEEDTTLERLAQEQAPENVLPEENLKGEPALEHDLPDEDTSLEQVLEQALENDFSEENPEWEPALEHDPPEEDPERVFPHAPKMDSTLPDLPLTDHHVTLVDDDSNSVPRTDPPEVFPRPPSVKIIRPKSIDKSFHENVFNETKK